MLPFPLTVYKRNRYDIMRLHVHGVRHGRALSAVPDPNPRGRGPRGRDALEGKGPQRRPQKRLDRRLEEVAGAVGGGWGRLQMPLKLALGVRGTVAGHRLGALEPGGYLPPCPGRGGVKFCFGFGGPF